jgi:hypothetical protein
MRNYQFINIAFAITLICTPNVKSSSSGAIVLQPMTPISGDFFHSSCGIGLSSGGIGGVGPIFTQISVPGTQAQVTPQPEVVEPIQLAPNALSISRPPLSQSDPILYQRTRVQSQPKIRSRSPINLMCSEVSAIERPIRTYLAPKHPSYSSPSILGILSLATSLISSSTNKTNPLNHMTHIPTPNRSTFSPGISVKIKDLSRIFSLPEIWAITALLLV